MEGKTKLYGWGLLIGGFCILALTAIMNYLQGDYIGVTWQGKLVNSAGSVAVDVVGLVICGLAAGACFAQRRWVWGAIFGLAVVGSAAWSANSMIAFQATERMSASKQRADIIERDKAADKLQVEDYKWKRGSARTSDGRTERKDFLSAADASLKSFRETKTEARIQPDAGAQWWSSWTGWSLETVQLSQAAYFGFLMILLKMICFPGSGYMLSWVPPPPARTVSGSNEGGGGNRKPTEETKDKQAETVLQFPSRAAPQGQFPAAHKVSSAAPEVPAPAPTVSILPTPHRKTVSEVIAENPVWPSNKAIAAATGLSKGEVSKEIKRLKGRGKLETKRNGKSQTVIARRNGGGLYAHPH